MKILYGVQGTGNGHIARARVMARAFAEREDIEVDFLFSGREPDKYFDMEIFGEYQTRRGLTFVTAEGAIQKWRTFRDARPLELYRDIRHLDVSGYAVVLNDFEPVSAWAARRHNTPVISVSHQAAFAFPVPKAGDTALDRMITRYFAPSDIKLGVHWYHFGHSIMPPFIEEKLERQPSNAHVLVYLPFESRAAIRELLAPFTDIRFECFHPDQPEEETDGHIHWHKTSKPRFREALMDASGVIANGGFELSSECLQLGKKLLIKPLNGQFEQTSNMITLRQLGLCTSMSHLDPQVLNNWLILPPQEPVQFPDNPHPLIDWLLRRDWQDTASICQQLWSQVQFPDAVMTRLKTLHASV